MQGCKLKQDKILLFKQVSDISYSNFGYVSGSTIFLRLANSANSFLTKLYFDRFSDLMLCGSSESKAHLRGKFELCYITTAAT